MKLIYTIIKILILLVFLLLAITNTHTVSFFYLPGQNVNLPLIVVLFGAFIIGIVFGMFALFGRLLSLRSENNRLRTEVKKTCPPFRKRPDPRSKPKHRQRLPKPLPKRNATNQ